MDNGTDAVDRLLFILVITGNLKGREKSDHNVGVSTKNLSMG